MSSSCRASPSLILASAALAALASPALADAADGPATEVAQVQVTATRVATPVDETPAFVSIVPGEDLRARGAHDLASALALVAGVEAPAGGDSGPASATPSFYGLHEFDAFLLVVDGVPWGGAFNPAISTLDLTNVERVEVLKGPAPVIYGATAFVGVIQVIHFPAGQASQQAEFGLGTHGSARGQAAMALPSAGGWRQSLAVEGERARFDDPRLMTSDIKAFYRGGGEALGGSLRLDLAVESRHDRPASPVVLSGEALTTLTPLDANFNPADARIDNRTWHGLLGYDRSTALGLWSSSVSLTYAEITDIRGFLRPSLDDSGAANADSQNQRRRLLDGYADTHVASRLAGGLELAWGADLLLGVGVQRSANGAYAAPLNGAGPVPAAAALHVDEINTVRDHRLFAGQYLQAQWRPDARTTVTLGARLNETSERKTSAHWDGFDPAADVSDSRRRLETRLTGSAGLTWKAWREGPDEAVLYADWRSAFKPAAVDFGPDYTPDILNSEHASTWQAGVKGALMGARLSFDLAAFIQDFRNLVIVEDDGSFANAGAQRMKGIEAEGRWKVTPDFALTAASSWHDARFTRYATASADYAGTQLALSPRWLASAGAIYMPSRGLFGTLTANWVGRRYLARGDQAPVGGYATVDASFGWRCGRWRFGLYGYNLGDARPPVTASEFGRQSFYRLNARSLFATLDARL